MVPGSDTTKAQKSNNRRQFCTYKQHVGKILLENNCYENRNQLEVCVLPNNMLGTGNGWTYKTITFCFKVTFLFETDFLHILPAAPIQREAPVNQ